MDTSLDRKAEEQSKSKQKFIEKNSKQDRNSMRTLQDDVVFKRNDVIKVDSFGTDILKTTNNKKAFPFSKATRFTSKSIFESNSN